MEQKKEEERKRYAQELIKQIENKSKDIEASKKEHQRLKNEMDEL